MSPPPTFAQVTISAKGFSAAEVIDTFANNTKIVAHTRAVYPNCSSLQMGLEIFTYFRCKKASLESPSAVLDGELESFRVKLNPISKSGVCGGWKRRSGVRSEEHTSEL